MTITVHAIYEQGVLRLTEPILLEEGTHVEVIVITKESQSVEKTPAEILAEIAAMPLEASHNDKFSGRDHDKILYS
ncbi:antitoxin family protein [Nostoc sp. CCY0012]|uniref:antitoxin family protein n=1 Tax=Nostoc sp. CCY0012 TaxID=1056123 RepID=UPI0039C6C140